MRLVPTAMMVGFLAMGLGACDSAPNVRLYNGAARPVVLHRPDADRAFDETTALKPGASKRFSGIYGRLALTSEGCTYDYRFPPLGVNFPWRLPDDSSPDYTYVYPVNVQFEEDFALYLMPSRAKAALPFDRLQDVQAHGFPLHPISKTCS